MNAASQHAVQFIVIASIVSRPMLVNDSFDRIGNNIYFSYPQLSFPPLL